MTSKQHKISLDVDSSIPGTLINLHERLWQLLAATSDRIDEFLDASFTAFQQKSDNLRSITYLRVLEFILRPKGFAFLQESAALLDLVARFAFFCVCNRTPPFKQIEILSRNEVFAEYCEDHLPNVLRWYRTAIPICHRMVNGLSNMPKTFSKSPSLVGKTPAEATRVHTAEVAEGRWNYPPADGKVRIHFFKDFQDTKSLPQEKGRPKPDVRIDLDFDLRRGVDLKAARKMLGAESLAIVTNISPYRRVFDPVSQDRLSPLAAYDLSKHLSEPIRVFEPTVSPFTRTKRAIQEPIYITLYFVFILLKSMLGFPLANPAYTSVAYGENFASKCNHISQALRPFNRWACEGVWLFIQLIGCLLLLPFVLVYHAVRGINSASVWVTRREYICVADLLMLILRSAILVVGRATKSVSDRLLSLSSRGWLAVLALSWFMIAEFKASLL